MKRANGSGARPVEGRVAAEGVCEVDCVDGHSVASARAALPADGELAATAAVLRVLGNPARLRLVLALDGCELCVCDCATLLGQSLSAASQHLKELRQIGAVRFRQDGKLAIYRLADQRLADVIRGLMTSGAEVSHA